MNIDYTAVLKSIKKYEVLLKPPSSEDLGHETELKCTCGGFLHESKPNDKFLIKLIGPKPKHKKKRILKKRMRIWTARARLHLLMAPLKNPNFVCGSCFKREGFYSAIGKNLFIVEPLPPGALPFYDRELLTNELESTE